MRNIDEQTRLDWVIPAYPPKTLSFAVV